MNDSLYLFDDYIIDEVFYGVFDLWEDFFKEAENEYFIDGKRSFEEKAYNEFISENKTEEIHENSVFGKEENIFGRNDYITNFESTAGSILNESIYNLNSITGDSFGNEVIYESSGVKTENIFEDIFNSNSKYSFSKELFSKNAAGDALSFNYGGSSSNFYESKSDKNAGNIILNISNSISVNENDDVDYIIDRLTEKIISYAKEASEGSHI